MEEFMTRQEHLDWCKKRALEYLDQGDVANAVTSMMSDMSKHEETRHAGESMTMLGMMYILQHDREGARRWIKGFR
jgi:Tfp pilus assembly protein PilF